MWRPLLQSRITLLGKMVVDTGGNTLSSVGTVHTESAAVWKPLVPSTTAKNTFNAIRNVVEKIRIKPHPKKELISLTLGDPTVHGCFKVPPMVNSLLSTNLDSFKYNGYGPASGDIQAREAIAQKASTDKFIVTADDVLITCGCSQAIEIAIASVANPGEDVVLLPRPGFPLYKCICDSRGINYRFYDLQPFNNWEVSLEHLRSLMDASVKLLVLNSPANPTGAVFSKKHLEDILKIAKEFRVPIASDEVYAHLAYRDHTYYPIASLSRDVPIIELNGLAKRFIVPGWRIGWVVIHDRNGLLQEVKAGMHNLTQIILGPPTIVQSAIKPLLLDTPPEYYSNMRDLLEAESRVVMEGLSRAHGLSPIQPQGGMYCMVHIDTTELRFEDDVAFTEGLLAEESVFVLPGECFQYPNFFRIVVTSPLNVLKEATERIQNFCERHKY